MSNINRTEFNTRVGVGMEGAVYETDTLTAAGAGTILTGTLLARSTASGKLIPFVKGGTTDGDGVVVAVAAADVVATGAGDFPVSALVKGSAMLKRLVIAADGNNSNIDAAVKDGLRDYGIDVRDTFDTTKFEA